MSPTQILVPAAAAAVLVLAGVGVGLAVDDDGPAGPGGLAPAAFGPPGGQPGGPPGAGPDGRHFRGGSGRPQHFRNADPDVLAVVRQIRAALAAKAPGIAGPIIDRALADKKITADQAKRLRDRIARRLERRGK